MKHEEVPVAEDSGTQTTTVCEAEAKVLHYKREPGMYSSDPRVKWLHLSSVEKQAILF